MKKSKKAALMMAVMSLGNISSVVDKNPFGGYLEIIGLGHNVAEAFFMTNYAVRPYEVFSNSTKSDNQVNYSIYVNRIPVQYSRSANILIDNMIMSDGTYGEMTFLIEKAKTGEKQYYHFDGENIKGLHKGRLEIPIAEGDIIRDLQIIGPARMWITEATGLYYSPNNELIVNSAGLGEGLVGTVRIENENRRELDLTATPYSRDYNLLTESEYEEFTASIGNHKINGNVKTEIISAASEDATNKANQAKTDAINTAAADATKKANQAEANAKADATTKANTAKTEAISVAATDATNKANQAKTDAINAAAADATNKANNAKTQAISTAATDATTKANQAEVNAKTYSDKKFQEDASFDKSVTVKGNETVNGNTTVNGSEIVNGNTTVKGNTTLGDSATDMVTVNGTSEFKENTTFDKGVAVKGNETINVK